MGGRGLLYIGLALGLLLLSGVAGILLTGGFTRFLPAPRVNGIALIPEARGVEAYDLSTGAQREILKANPDGWAGAVDATQDGTRLVVQTYEPSSEGGIGKSRILIVEADGSQRVVAEPLAGEFLAEPRWSADASSIFFTRRLTRRPNPGESKERVERIDVQSGAREVVLENAASPFPTPDGTALVLLRDDQNAQSVSVFPLNGGEPRDLVPSNLAPSVLSPIISPDGRTVAFSMIDGASAAGSEGGLADAVGRWLVPSALAHGVPFDVYLIPFDGSGPAQRLTHVNQDSPFTAWSSDGRWLLVRAEYSQFLADSKSGQTWKLNDNGGYGQIDWAPSR
jgi:hypothetical protein